MDLRRTLTAGRTAGLLAAALAAMAAAAACARTPRGVPEQERSASQAGAAAQADQEAGWRSLFDGTTTAGWREYKSGAPAGWAVVDGALTKTQATRDIITTDQFADFELEFEWRIAVRGNAGVFYRATEEYDHVYWSAPEYQLLDDANAPDGRNRLTSAASAYGLYAAPEGHLKPAGEWNATRIVARGARVEHWLNGSKVVEYDLWSPDWEARVKASKFGAWPNYGRARRGHIAVQGDHGGELALRNIRIRELK